MALTVSSVTRIFKRGISSGLCGMSAELSVGRERGFFNEICKGPAIIVANEDRPGNVNM